MKRICLIGICLFALLTSVGCCYRPGGVDPTTGMAYGGIWEPACAGPLDPLGFWCWVSAGGTCAPWNQYGGYPGSVGQMSPYGYSPYVSYPPGAMIEDPCGCGNAFPTFQGPIPGSFQGPVEYSYPPAAPPTEREDVKGKTKVPSQSAATTHFQTTWTTPVGDGAGVVAH